MKIKYNYFLVLVINLIIIFQISNLKAEEKNEDQFISSLSNKEACQLYYSKVANSKNPRSKGMYPIYSYLGVGFLTHKYTDDKVSKYLYKNKDGNFTVGKIYNLEVVNKISSGDAILSYDQIDFNNLVKYVDYINSKKEGDIINFVLKDKNKKKYKASIVIDYNSYTEMSYEIHELNINKIDIKNNIYNISIDHDFRYQWNFKNNVSKKNHILYELALGNILYKVSNSNDQWGYYLCSPDESDFIFSQLVDPSTYKIRRLVKADKSLQTSSTEITPYSKKTNNRSNSVWVSRNFQNIYDIKNDFNLKSFPFDKQIIKFEFIDDKYNLDVRIIDLMSRNYETLNNFMKIDDIPGWSKIKYKINFLSIQEVSMKEGDYSNGFSLSLTLERKYGYYIFKVIFPIILILLICWASVWIDPKELESRLTITIVCLLSLIAYNFVIDSELPKLEYLTVLDWFILISYVYATIPNLLSIYSFRIYKNKKVLSDQVESFAKKYGISSYVVITFFIIALNANLNPENSSSLISWMSVSK